MGSPQDPRTARRKRERAAKKNALWDQKRAQENAEAAKLPERLEPKARAVFTSVVLSRPPRSDTARAGSRHDPYPSG
jgi:hypothetical protein